MSNAAKKLANLGGMVRRGLKKPPRYILARIVHEVNAQLERRRAPARAAAFSQAALLRELGRSDIDACWAALAARPFLAAGQMDGAALEALGPGETARILEDAARAVRHEIDLLGSGPIALGARIDWHKDYKTGIRWQPAYCRDIEYNNLDQPSDVKFPWEVSRMQWMIPLGQAYALTGDETHAQAARALLEDWIAGNPYAWSINWACTMDVAIRAITWTWLFHAFHASQAWRDAGFRSLFLRALFLHGDFITRHLEKSDVNGNHYTADAAGLVFVGLFFEGARAAQWAEQGWAILSGEIDIQVFPDGVDFEASIPYHRLVQELFLYPALLRQRLGLEIAPAYAARLLAMARFTEAYSRPDGGVPLWGDADDARTLPFRMLPINDHRYLIGIAGLTLGDAALVEAFSGSRAEAAWLLGTDRAAALPDTPAPRAPRRSATFADGGFYVLRNATDQVFVDCGPLGLADRGGHGHNDLLSFDAMLDGVLLASDCGAYLYTADYLERNNFRSTAYHNTPQIDGAEINRFIRPDYLWFLRNDARFEVVERDFGAERDRLVMRHTGYARLDDPVIVTRTLTLDHARHALTIEDAFAGQAEHLVEVPIQLAPGVTAELDAAGGVLHAGGKQFALSWNAPQDWVVDQSAARVSPSYGVALPATRLRWRRTGPLRPLSVTIRPR